MDGSLLQEVADYPSLQPHVQRAKDLGHGNLRQLPTRTPAYEIVCLDCKGEGAISYPDRASGELFDKACAKRGNNG
jgi:hypothetical protein